jgi:hypothetical protein
MVPSIAVVDRMGKLCGVAAGKRIQTRARPSTPGDIGDILRSGGGEP